jgi:hypothetical protein
MQDIGTKRASHLKLQVLFVTLCAILLLFTAPIQLMHVHADGLAHADCAVCHSAHQVAEPSAPQFIQQVVLHSTRVAVLDEQMYREHTFSFSHWNRPPPDQTAIA